MKQKSRIYLVGFMGSGKSYIGKLLAEALQYHFIDLDEEFENRAIISISEYFERIGEESFRMKEAEILRTHYRTECIYATGGGAPSHYDNMNWMNDHGLTIYLKQPVDALFARLKEQKEQRPLLKNKSNDELHSYISEMMESRSAYYEEADVVYEGQENDLEKLIEQINVLPLEEG